MRASILDLGSNSFHVLIADLDGNGTLVPVGREREMLHLGALVQRHGEIPGPDRRRAVDVVAHLTELAGRLGAEERLAVATSALRDARNGRDVVADMEAAADTPIRIIDGDEEARLAYLGVRASVALDADPLLVLDLGGGSLELAVGTGGDVSWSASLDLGVSRLSTLVADDPPNPDDVARLRDRIAAAVRPLRQPLEELGPEATVAVGGTIRALARVIAAEEHTWLPATLNQYAIPTGEVEGLRDRLVRLDTDERAAIPGMKSKRADRIHVAAIVLATTLEVLDLEGFVLSDWGLREGALLEAVGATPVTSPEELRRREIQRMLDTFVPDDPHLLHVADLATRLFDGTRDLHGLGAEDRELLWCGAALHDVGESLALRGHHKHGAYLIEHAELRGFSPTQTATMCTLVRFHKSRGLSTSFPPYGSLRKRHRRRADQLTALLQLADGLDRARDQAVRDVSVRREDGRVEILLHGEGLHIARAEVDRKTELFERTFGIDVVVRDAVR